MNKAIIAGIVIVAAAAGIMLASPLFYDTSVDEALPMSLDQFRGMNDDSRMEMASEMSENQRDTLMESAAQTDKEITEEMDAEVIILAEGSFAGLAGHRASGQAQLLDVYGQKYLRFEGLDVTNGPDLRVYLTSGGNVGDGIHIDKLKGNRGDQNYPLGDIDIEAYDTVVIYCQPFGVYFGEAQLA